MTAKVAIALIVATTVFSGCSSDDEPSQPTVSDMALPTLATATTTTAAATTTSMLPASTTTTTTTMISTTTPTTVTSPTTSTPTPTLVSPDDITEAEALDRQMAIDVEATWRTYVARFRAAQMAPGDEKALAELLNVVTPEWAERMKALIERLRETNRRLLPEPVVEATLTVESPPAAVADTSDEVTIIVCEVDSWVLVESSSAPDGSDVVVNDTIYANRDEVRLRIGPDGVWRVVQVNQLEQYEGAVTCGT